MDEEKVLKEIQDKIKDVGAHLEESRKKQEEYEKRLDHIPGDIKDTEDRIVKDLTGKFITNQDAEQRLEAISQRQDELRTTLDQLMKLGTSRIDEKEEKQQKHRSMLFDYLSYRGEPNDKSPELREYMMDAEYRALTESTNTEGGFLVDPIIESEIIKDIVNISPVRSVARITTIGTGKEWEIKKRTGEPTATWELETGTGTESSSTYGTIKIPVHPQLNNSTVSIDLIDDYSNMESEIVNDATEELGRLEGVAFVVGDGVNKPAGFMANGDITQTTGADAGNDLVDPDDFWTLVSLLKSGYRQGARFGFNSTVLGKILKFKDSNNQYLWPFSLRDGPPSLIAGWPYTIFEDMASDGTDAALPLIFGNFQMGYRIIDRSGIQINRDDLSGWPVITYKIRRRVGGAVIQPEAFKMIIV